MTPKYINDSQGNLLTTEKDIQNRWKEYFDQLLNEEFPRSTIPPTEDSVTPDLNNISVEEKGEALKKMKRGKAAGPDDIPAEFWKCCGGGDVGHKFLCILFIKIQKGNSRPN